MYVEITDRDFYKFTLTDVKKLSPIWEITTHNGTERNTTPFLALFLKVLIHFFWMLIIEIHGSFNCLELLIE